MSTTDEQIRAAYERLDEALAPPMDGAARVERRIAVRRRRRRTGVAGAAVVVLVAVTGGVVAARSGSDGDDTVAVDQGGLQSTLVLTRPDGSTYAFDDVTVTCQPPKGEEPVSGPQRIWALSPRTIKDQRPVEPFVYFNGIVSKIEGDQTFTFPNDWEMDSDHLPMVLFMADSEGNADRSNEVATSAGGSGTVRVLEASCDPTPVLRLQVDATLGSEVEQQSLKIAGALG